MVSKPILDLDVGSVSFGHVILWDTTRTLCLHENYLSHPISDRRETLRHYISTDFSQPSKRVLKP